MMGNVEREVLVENSVEKFLYRIYFCQFNSQSKPTFQFKPVLPNKNMIFMTKTFSLTKSETYFWILSVIFIMKTVADLVYSYLMGFKNLHYACKMTVKDI